jgi:hypothetical protein
VVQKQINKQANTRSKSQTKKTKEVNISIEQQQQKTGNELFSVFRSLPQQQQNQEQETSESILPKSLVWSHVCDDDDDDDDLKKANKPHRSPQIRYIGSIGNATEKGQKILIMKMPRRIF